MISRTDIKQGILAALRIVDRRRWENIQSYDTRWNARIEAIAGMIQEETRVLEIGAGRQSLRDILPEGVHYQAADLVDLNEYPTLILDLNKRPLPEFDPIDSIIMAGVLEYISEVEEVVEHLQRYCTSFIVSYEPCEHKSFASRWKRRKRGWFNDLTRSEFLHLFEHHGFVLKKEETWHNQFIVLLQR